MRRDRSVAKPLGYAPILKKDKKPSVSSGQTEQPVRDPDPVTDPDTDPALDQTQEDLTHGFFDGVSSGWRVRSRALASNASERRETDIYSRIVDQLANVNKRQSDALLQAELFRNSYAGAGGGLDADITASVEQARVDAFDTINENREAFPQYDGDGPVTEKVAADQRLEYERQFMESESDRERTILGHIGSIVGDTGGVLGQPEVILTAVIGTAIPAFGGYGLARTLGFEAALTTEGVVLSEEKVRESHKEVGLSRTDSDLVLEMTMAVAGTFAVGYGLKYGVLAVKSGSKRLAGQKANVKAKLDNVLVTSFNKMSPEGQKKLIDNGVEKGTVTPLEGATQEVNMMKNKALQDIPGDTTIEKRKNLVGSLIETEAKENDASNWKKLKAAQIKKDAEATAHENAKADAAAKIDELYEVELASMPDKSAKPIREIRSFTKDKDAHFETLKTCMLGSE